MRWLAVRVVKLLFAGEKGSSRIKKTATGKRKHRFEKESPGK